MAELLTAVQTADAVQGLLGGVVKLVERILQARRDVQNLPQNIEELLQEVEGLKPVIDSVKSGSLDKNGFLKPRLEKLQEALHWASGQLNDFKEKQKPGKSKVVKVAIATVNLGDSKRQKEINSTRETIKGLREELDKALSVSTHLTGESTHTIVKETHLMVKEALVQKTVVVSSSVVTPPAIIAKFNRWARECTGDESYKIHFMQWDSESREYRLPEQGSRRETPGEDDKDEGDEIKRGAREGGWEVKNSTKVQFHIEVPRDSFFYVVSYEMPFTIPTNLELFFPKYARDKNKILSRSKRRFPDVNKYKTDPLSCKVDQSLESLTAGIEGQVLFYLVLSAEPLVHLDSVKEVDINDFIEQLSRTDPGEGSDLPFYVKRFLFDVK